MSPTVEVTVLPGSVFCIKVLSALEYKQISYSLVGVSPTRMKKDLPAPHLVPVMKYGSEQIPDSQKILKYIDSRHSAESKPLYPTVSQGAAEQWSTVEDLEKFSHDALANLYFYFSSCTQDGRKNVTIPFVRNTLPPTLVKILPFVPALGARAFGASISKKAKGTLGDKVATEQAAKKYLFECMAKLETSFKSDDQKYLFATAGPTAADFAVFSTLKRFVHPLPDVAPGLMGGYPDLFKETGKLPRLEKFFLHMNKDFYEGKIDWTAIAA